MRACALRTARTIGRDCTSKGCLKDGEEVQAAFLELLSRAGAVDCGSIDDARQDFLWGAPRIHGELLMLGIEIAESTVGRYMVRRRRPPSQGWKTFLRNHAAGIASLDLFVVSTISFKLLYGLVVLRHARRRLVAISVTPNPTAEWIARQVTDAFPWEGGFRTDSIMSNFP